MTPIAILQTTLKVNKSIAQFVLSGLVLLAAGAIAISWNAQPKDILLVAGYILGLAFAVSIIAYIVTQPKMRAVLGWAITGLFTLFMLGLIDSFLNLSGRLPTPACYIRIFFEPPKVCENRLFPAVRVDRSSSPINIATGGPEKLWLAQAAPGPVSRHMPYDSGAIYLQYSDPTDASRAQGLADELTNLGWPVVSIDQVKQAPGQNEVRFFHNDNSDDALELAQTLQSLSPGRDVYLRDFSQSGLRAANGLLEIWLP